jgi:hypothetical protein
VYEIDLSHQCSRDTDPSVWLVSGSNKKHLHDAKQKHSYDIGFSLPGCLYNGDHLDSLRNDGHVGEDVRNPEVDEECFLC